MLKGIFIAAAFVVLAALTGLISFYNTPSTKPEEIDGTIAEISGCIQKGETLFDIFKRSGLDLQELFMLRESTAGLHKLSELLPGQPYSIAVDGEKRVTSFVYWINDDAYVNVRRGESGFSAEKITLEYEKRLLYVTGAIEEALITSIGEGREILALDLSDIFAWDIDFNTDLRKGDTFLVIVEGLFREDLFKKYGNILAAEFVNDGQPFRAYRFEINGKAGYYDAEGRALKKQFLKAPLSFRHISSGFSRSRMHPILRIRRPHNGVDYVAPAGTPVSAMADGRVTFSGYKGQYGRLVILHHRNGYETYYGHLSRIKGGIRSGSNVSQGQVIGYVGSTGLATGPHLHFEMRRNHRPLNPRKAEIPRGAPIPAEMMAEFNNCRDRMDRQMASLRPSDMAQARFQSEGTAR